jgi:hypothetical protein
MRKPRLIYENDARHHLLYRFAPPLSVHRLRQPVDELLGTSVDTLFYGFVSQQTQPFEAKAGLYWLWHRSEQAQVMWWRGGQNLKQALEAGNDPLKIAVDRAHEHGIQVLTWLHWEAREPDSDDFNTYSDHVDPEVRRRRLETIEDACDRYELDGIGLNYYVPSTTFSAEVGRPTDAPNNPPALTGFVREVRALLDRIGEKRGQRLGLAVQVHSNEDANTESGLEVRKWLSEKLVDLVVPTSPHPNSPQDTALLDTNPSLDWMVEAAHEAGAWVYAPIVNAVYDDRQYEATIEMYRAAATNHLANGADGLYLSSLRWPHTANEYEILREMGYPAVYSRKTKHYMLGHRAADSGAYAPVRKLPIMLEEGVPSEVTVFVGDALDAARQDGELDRVTLGVRIVQVGDEDTISFKLNGHDLPVEQATIEWIYGGSVSYMAQRGELPRRIHTHLWYTFHVPPNALQEGENVVQVTLDRRDDTLITDRVLHAMEIKVFYDEPHSPSGGQM